MIGFLNEFTVYSTADNVLMGCHMCMYGVAGFLLAAASRHVFNADAEACLSFVDRNFICSRFCLLTRTVLFKFEVIHSNSNGWNFIYSHPKMVVR